MNKPRPRKWLQVYIVISNIQSCVDRSEMFLNSNYAFAIHSNWMNKVENVFLFILYGTRAVVGGRY